MSKTKLRKWSKQETILFLSRLSMYLRSGIGIIEAIEHCSINENNYKKDIMQKISNEVSSGATLSNSLEYYAKVPKIVVGILYAGERSASIIDSLDQSKELLERNQILKKKILSASLYPIVIGIFSLILLIGMVKFVLPQIIPMLIGLNAELPLITRVVIFLSNLTSEYGVYIFSSILLIFFLLIFSYKKVRKIKYFFHKILSITPIIKSIVILATISTWSRSLGSMLKARMTISDAYNISSNSVSLLPIHDYFCSNANNLSMGKGISNLLFEMKNLVPNYMISLVQAGEKSGSLDLALTRIADIADIEIDTKLKRLTALVEPMLMIAMGIIVGTIALSIMLPIYDISKTLQR